MDNREKLIRQILKQVAMWGTYTEDDVKQLMPEQPDWPLDGMQMNLMVVTPHDYKQYATTPLPIKPEVMDYYLNSFKEQFWADWKAQDKNVKEIE